MNEAEFKDKDWYKLRVKTGAKFDKSRTGTVYALIRFDVMGGPMEGKEIPAEWYLTDDQKSKDYFVRKMALLGFDAIKENLKTMGEKIAGTIVFGQCEIGVKKDGKGFWPPKIVDVRDVASMTPGGPESDAAQLLGNTSTPPPDDDEWNDQI